LFDVLQQRKTDVENVMRPIKGFVSYTLARSGDGGFSVTVCQDKAGTDESVRVAKEWVAKNAGNTGAGAPTVAEGSLSRRHSPESETVKGGATAFVRALQEPAGHLVSSSHF
jgi:hypothetical protein